MYPVCLANLAVITAGATSTSGLAALAVKKISLKFQTNHQTNETREGRNENRNNGTENERHGSESF
jgi:hypothetical protein